MRFYFIVFGIFFFTALMVFLQHKYEKKVLEIFQNAEHSLLNRKLIDEFNIDLISINWLPITGKHAATILFEKTFKCELYDGFIILSTKDYKKDLLRLIVEKSSI